jgi:hypothetical protein
LRKLVTRQLQECERWLALEKRLPAVLQGQAKPASAAERLALAQLCQRHKEFYAASARFYAEAFAEEPGLAQDLRAGHRYNAACAAALASAGRGHDAAKLDDPERARLRQQALGWLRADLGAWAQVLDKAPAKARPVVRRTLAHWRADADLAGVRDKAELARLPEAERAAWRGLWADVAAMRQRAGEE